MIFIAYKNTVKVTPLKPKKNNQIADGLAQNKVIVSVVDAKDNPLPSMS